MKRLMEFSEDQIKALESLNDWFKSSNVRTLTLGGYAGTGKTTLIAHFRNELAKYNPLLKVSFCSYTGKGALVLRNYLNENFSKYPKDFVGTIHSLIYTPILNSKGHIVDWAKKDEIKTDLIIIDEASMIDLTIWNDLVSFGKPILAVGDHGQLPPINSEFNLMKEPQIKLSQIHRQAQDNPIIKMSVLARNQGKIPAGKYGKGIFKISTLDFDYNEKMNESLNSYDEDTLILCGFNSTRVKINNYIRNIKGIENEEPVYGDRVICLRNNHKMGIFNGMIGDVRRIKRFGNNTYEVEIRFDEGTDYEGLAYKDQFNSKESINYTERRLKAGKCDLFDFGYAITVHKAQGSQARKVVLFEERFSKMDDSMWARWLYTAVTRAQKQLEIYGN